MSETKKDVTFLLTPAEVQKQLGIAEATLKKYAQLLERKGYIFHRDNKGHRGYTDTDMTLLRKLMRRKNETGMTLESAADELISIVLRESESDTATKDISEYQKHNKDIEALKQMIQQQNEVIKSLGEELQKHAEYIDKSLKERDKKLLEGIRLLQEQKREKDEAQKLIAAAKEEIENSQKKKGFFTRLFGG
ncbi:MerR family transcriptional regulator [Bacillus sp. FJAT-47783]|uniref:MerR family transcriptional regulator n=1 Tax=Bacillus sp. FJAT-47783 TaxID=2922712 RepID=UPI001FABB093|nr:MerR family transcriptional regulator [Bacillus sp. FJAT-47783]